MGIYFAVNNLEYYRLKYYVSQSISVYCIGRTLQRTYRHYLEDIEL